MAAAGAWRKRSATAFMGEVVPEPPHLAQRGRFSLCPGVAALAFDPLDALRQRQARERAADAAARADGGGGGVEECAAVLVEQMSAAADAADARGRASWILRLVKGAVAKRAAASLAEESGAFRAQAAAALREEKGALEAPGALLRARAEELERDNGVLKRGVAARGGRARGGGAGGILAERE